MRWVKLFKSTAKVAPNEKTEKWRNAVEYQKTALFFYFRGHRKKNQKKFDAVGFPKRIFTTWRSSGKGCGAAAPSGGTGEAFGWDDERISFQHCLCSCRSQKEGTSKTDGRNNHNCSAATSSPASRRLVAATWLTSSEWKKLWRVEDGRQWRRLNRCWAEWKYFVLVCRCWLRMLVVLFFYLVIFLWCWTFLNFARPCNCTTLTWESEPVVLWKNMKTLISQRSNCSVVLFAERCLV